MGRRVFLIEGHIRRINIQMQLDKYADTIRTIRLHDKLQFRATGTLP